MKTFFIVMMLAAAGLGAQTKTLTLTGPATAKPGDTVALTLTAAGGTNTNSAGIQWTMGLPSGGYTATATAGTAATAATKTLSCTADTTFCMLWGMNATIIGNGVVTTYSVKVPAGAVGGGVSFPLSGILGATAAGLAQAISAGTPYTLTVQVPIKQDLNGDGKTDAADVQLMVNEVVAAQGSPGACVHDMTGDGKCDLLDVIMVLLKALGQ